MVLVFYSDLNQLHHQIFLAHCANNNSVSESTCLCIDIINETLLKHSLH